MTPRELIRLAACRLSDAGVPDPSTDAALLLSHLTGKPFLALRLDTETLLSDSVISEFNVLAEKRAARIPLQYLLGEAPFFRRMFKVDSRVLIPRPETELLCEWALEILTGLSGPRVLDLCCGSGCIGLTLKAERPDAHVSLSDISSGALNVAAVNAARLSLDVSFCLSDLLDGFADSSFDLIVTNPPYIPAAECPSLQPEVLSEPLLALDGGADGCACYRRIISKAVDVLLPGGHLLMEIGAGEADYLSGLLSACGFVGHEIRQDYSGIDRMILSSRPD